MSISKNKRPMVILVLGAIILLFVLIDAFRGEGISWAGLAGSLFLLAIGFGFRTSFF